MISAVASASFVDSGVSGSSLLDDLLRYVYEGQGCRLLLIGDPAQLPPVGEEEAPALQSSVMRGFGMRVYESTLSEVVRQAEESGILWNATRIRRMQTDAAEGFKLALPRIRFRGFADVLRVPGDELIESLSSSYSRVGIDDTMVVTRSNKRANVYNLGIRNTILDREDELTTLYGFRFADVWLQFPDYDDYEMTSTVLLDTLTTEAPALTHEQSDQLFQAVLEDYSDIPQKAERMKKMKEDPYYNALQVKFAYAVTCHKAQGGQWAHVYIDQGYMTDDMLTPDYVRWLYTAFTRATDKVFLVNWPKNQEE